ncbi:HNH endonuclease [Desulfobacterales bacterium HSG16]|nr:HNH endonuclease [Desulfobacterales bacterium HSG16]
MKECIICRKETKRDDFSVEHVIPEALGGNYTIKSVCRECNSFLGKRIDSGLVNNLFSDIMRYKKQLPGKTGKIPTPLSGVFKDQANRNIKVRIKYSTNNEIIHEVLPIPQMEKDKNGNIKNILISCNEHNISNKDECIEKLLKRHDLYKEKTGITSIEKELLPHHTTQTHEINWGKIAIGLLKIAYEFTVNQITEYYGSCDARMISKILLNNDLSSAYNAMQKDPIIGIDKKTYNIHWVTLGCFDQRLHCHIAIDELFDTFFIMSNQCYEIDKDISLFNFIGKNYEIRIGQ